MENILRALKVENSQLLIQVGQMQLRIIELEDKLKEVSTSQEKEQV